MAKRPSQRDIVTELYEKYGNDFELILEGVEEAVARGEFRRERNAKNQPLRQYVKFLLDAGLHDRGTSNTGWLLK